MPTVHIETNLIARDQYEFIQTWVNGETNADERTFTETHEDRMYAAMTNLGYACKWLTDDNFVRGSVCIVTDKDGQDQRYNGEHDDLFKAIHSQRDYQLNRAKYAILYGRYVKYLDRIRELANAYEIAFTQNAREMESGKLKVESEDRPIDRSNPFLIRNRKWTRENILKLSLAGAINTATCMACQASINYEQTDKFTAFRQPDRKGRQVMIRSNKQLVKNFQEIHLGLHLNYEK